MARTATITEKQILDAARAVFLEQGVNATAVDVANRAGISSASIFKRYPTKEALLIAAMSETPFERVWTKELEASIGHGDTRADLLVIAQRIAFYTEKIMPRMMLLRAVGAFPEPPRIGEDFAMLTAYFGKEMALGRIARGDPTIPALALLHTSVGFISGRTLRPDVSGVLDANSFLGDFVGVLWQGLNPSARAQQL
jgi:AcrR family transcriptional regulator